MSCSFQMFMQVIAGHLASGQTAPRWAAQVVVTPVPTSCSQKGLLAEWAISDCERTWLAPPETTKPSVTSSARAVSTGGWPKCMATARSRRRRICRLPATSLCGMGLSIMATCPYRSSDLRCSTALEVLSRVEL